LLWSGSETSARPIGGIVCSATARAAGRIVSRRPSPSPEDGTLCRIGGQRNGLPQQAPQLWFATTRLASVEDFAADAVAVRDAVRGERADLDAFMRQG
jgi:hypothetical protein